MMTITVNVPDSLVKAAKLIEDRDGTSIERLIISALGEKLSALLEDYLAERGKRGDRAKFEAVLKNVPDVPPEEHDRLDP